MPCPDLPRMRRDHILAKLMPNSVITSKSKLRALPSIDELLRADEVTALQDRVGSEHLKFLARRITEELRRELSSRDLVDDRSPFKTSRKTLIAEATRRLTEACRRDSAPGIQRVINATGVILHTNLGRAPLSEAAREALLNAAGYCTLEYDVETGRRGRRGRRVEDLLIELTGAEAALVVNNCAAAALLVLTVLAKDGETIVSRSELVEIGGDFRVPDVMATSGTRMVEVGTTNRTKLDDYCQAMNERTRLIMRVHQSNYRIVGFTTAPALVELAGIAHAGGLPLYEDAGSGALVDLGPYGLGDEPAICQSISAGADVVSFSGDKLLGAVQAGLIVGRQEIIDRLRKHPLYRALRLDKLSLAALEATLDSHRSGSANTEIPVLHMLAMSSEIIEKRATALVDAYQQTKSSSLELEVVAGKSAIGGGSGPAVHPPTALIAVNHPVYSADYLQQALRLSRPPIITRIADNRVLIDLRTVEPAEEVLILQAFRELKSQKD